MTSQFAFRTYQRHALAAVSTAAMLVLAAPAAHAEPVVANNCPAVGDLSAQMAGWRNRGKTMDQAKAQVDKYYSDATDRETLHRVVELVYLDPHKRLVPEQVSVQITSECLTQQAQAAKHGAPASGAAATHP